ncbi:hypothetical protein ABBQ38_011436 [Trebouxia sp. C0009 RCD-2024]
MDLFPELEGNYLSIEPLHLVGNAFRRGRQFLDHLRRLARRTDRKVKNLKYPQAEQQEVSSQLSRSLSQADSPEPLGAAYDCQEELPGQEVACQLCVSIPPWVVQASRMELQLMQQQVHCSRQGRHCMLQLLDTKEELEELQAGVWFVDSHTAMLCGYYAPYQTGAFQMWTALIAGTWMGLVHLDYALRCAVDILVLTRESFECGSAVEDVVAVVLAHRGELYCQKQQLLCNRRKCCSTLQQQQLDFNLEELQASEPELSAVFKKDPPSSQQALPTATSANAPQALNTEVHVLEQQLQCSMQGQEAMQQQLWSKAGELKEAKCQIAALTWHLGLTRQDLTAQLHETKELAEELTRAEVQLADQRSSNALLCQELQAARASALETHEISAADQAVTGHEERVTALDGLRHAKLQLDAHLEQEQELSRQLAEVQVQTARLQVPTFRLTASDSLKLEGSRQLGEGVNGAVRVFDTPVYPNAVLKSGKQGSLEREAALMASLHHPTIARVIAKVLPPGVPKDPSQPGFLLLEKMGFSLRKKDSVDSHGGAPALLRKALHLASALRHMHMQRPAMVHQDLHRGNVLCSLDQRSWHLVDFGAASFTHHQGTPVSLTQKMCGTGLETPELAQSWMDQGCYNPHPTQDVWAFGLLLLRCIGGKKPREHTEAFTAGTTIAYSASLAQADPPYHEQVWFPPDMYMGTEEEKDLLHTIIKGCLQVDASKRWTIVQVTAALHKHLPAVR